MYTEYHRMNSLYWLPPKHSTVKTSAIKLVDRVYREVVASGDAGVTSSDIGEVLGKDPGKISPRLSELYWAKLIVKKGRRRTLRGRTATVYVDKGAQEDKEVSIKDQV